jgi:hypothetical protein
MGRPFDGYVEYTKRVSSTCLIHLERNRYSAPASFANRPVSLRVYPARLVVVAEGQIVCEHPRVIDRTHNGPGRTIYDWRHYLAVIQRKPGALRNGAPFLELPDAFGRLQQHLLRRPGGDREMVEILALVLHHDEQAVLVAVELALEDGVPSKTHILNRLHRTKAEAQKAVLFAGKNTLPALVAYFRSGPSELELVTKSFHLSPEQAAQLEAALMSARGRRRHGRLENRSEALMNILRDYKKWRKSRVK